MEAHGEHRFALVREIPDSFDHCIKPRENPEIIDVPRARLQHTAYCQSLSRLGLDLIRLASDNRYPDCAFVEDTAVVIVDRAVMTRPGAKTRRGEIRTVQEALAAYKRIDRIVEPATLDGGDVLQAEDVVFVGLSKRTNRDGFLQMESLLRESHRRVVPVPLAKTLHLKTACNYLGKGFMVVNSFDFDPALLTGFNIIQPHASEAAKLSILAVGESVLLPDDCPKTRQIFERKGWHTIVLDLSEIRKAQAGLTCMSVLFHG
jgi:dimethylargininase